jgi:Glycosyl transferases group 1
MVDLDALLSNKNIIMVYPWSCDEVSAAKIGATRIIYEQIESLKSTGHTVNLLSLEEVGSLMSFFLKLERRIRQKGSLRKPGSSENRRWQLNLLAGIVGETLSRVDLWFTMKLEKKLKNFEYPASIIYNGVGGFVAFNKVAKKFGATVAIYSHDPEWKFFENNTVSNKFTAIGIAMWKKIELSALRKADHISCSTKSDLNILKEAIGDANKIDVWYVLNQTYCNKPPMDIIDQALKQKLYNKFVAGFIGANFGPNIISVRNTIDIAKKMLDSKIVFLIIGNVSEAFDKENVPTNIIFTGHVHGLDSYLYLCDAFLNLKTTSHTGLEAKMWDYLKFNKPVIATQIGASGFENNRNVIVVEDIADAHPLLLGMAEAKAKKLQEQSYPPA